jgi:uncharacterized protein (TIGR03085 family)
MPTALDAAEREALCDLFLELGPDAPTLCEGWTTADLAAHLVVRERRPVAAAGIVVGPLAGVTERAMEDEKAKGYGAVVARVRGGPPPGPYRFGPVRSTNLNEFFVHHEDVRRPNGRPPRTGMTALDDALWRAIRRSAWLSLRRLGPVGAVLVRAGTGERVVARKGEPAVTLTGEPGELALYLTGRRSAAEVGLAGPEEAVAALRAVRLGI